MAIDTRDIFGNVDAATEAVARALCYLRNGDPDLMVPGRKSTFEGVGGSTMAAIDWDNRRPLWRHFIPDARAAIEAMPK